MRTIVVTNERGGIGKTTLTCHIAWHLAEQGKRVVVLDLDKQCHSAGMLAAEFEQLGPIQSILDFEPDDEPPALACFKNTRQVVELTTDGPQQRQHIASYVRAIRAGLAQHYDYCVIDTAPAWDGRNLMALIASDYVAVPLDPDKTARQSLSEISQSMHLANKVRGEGNPARFGIVFNRVQATSEISRQLMDRITQALPANVIPHTIPHREHVREAALLEVPVWRLAKDTRRSAPIVREVVSYIVDQAEKEAA
ncbi:AAA family ATPase [Novosphingobium sp. RD2P27]|uniref:AAA family ATPase n=1 Tax=Novosphingobium kalidii TaxID=3230299 RepID=A0ABV2D3S2_9SPHN